MNNEGWTLGDLAGELWARGIDINKVPDDLISATLWIERPEQAANLILRELT